MIDSPKNDNQHSGARPSALASARRRLSAIRRFHIARLLLVLDGILLALVGVIALQGSTVAFQGDELPLFIAGIALVSFGVMIVFRWNLRAVKTGLAGLTAGYFAAMLSAFEVATDPCDIASTMAQCVGQVAGGTPWAVYQGPLIIAALLFILLALEPYVSEAQEQP